MNIMELVSITENTSNSMEELPFIELLKKATLVVDNTHGPTMTASSNIMDLPLNELLKQATIVVDNARSPTVTASHSTYPDIPALCYFKGRLKKNSKSQPSRTIKKRSESFPSPERSRWDCAVSLISASRSAAATTVTTAASQAAKQRPHRCSSSDDIHKLDSSPRVDIFKAQADSLPRQPRRESSVRTILSEALEVIAGLP
jgi:hypothetical protein